MTQHASHRPALLFDLDGTLVDSVYQHVLTWLQFESRQTPVKEPAE